MKKSLPLMITAVMLLAVIPASTAFAAPEAQNISARFTSTISPSGLFLKSDGTLLITDLFSKSVYSQKNGVLTRLTGGKDILGADSIPVGGYVDGDAKNAQFSSPWGIAPYSGGYAITDTDNHAVRLLKDGKVSTITKDFKRPTGIAAGENGSLYVSDTETGLIKRIDSAGNVAAFAGGIGFSDGKLSEARFREPTGLCYSGGALYVADSGNHRICKIEKGIVTTLVGFREAIPQDIAYEGGYIDGEARRAQLSSPQGIAVSGDTVYFSDTGNSAIRTIKNGVVGTFRKPATDTTLYPVSPRGIVVSGNSLIYGDTFANGIFTEDITKAPVAPVTPPATTVYVVKLGDTLSKIATANGCTVKELADLNKLANPNLIYVNQKLILPRK